MGRAVLILGPSGAGKSGLSLDLMALGFGLIADDRVILTKVGSTVIAAAPDATKGMIEARGIGLLRAQPHPPAPVDLVIDLSQIETQRLPETHKINLLGCDIELLHKPEIGHFPAAVLQYLKIGRIVR